MKTAILILIAATCVFAAFGQLHPPPPFATNLAYRYLTPQTNELSAVARTNYIAYLRTIGQLSNVVHQLLAEGEICKTKGSHYWRVGRVGESPTQQYADGRYHEFRTCQLCGTEQVKTESWGPQ